MKNTFTNIKKLIENMVIQLIISTKLYYRKI